MHLLKVVMFGTFDEEKHPRVRVILEAAENLGHRVIVCNEPLGISTQERIQALRRPWRFGKLLLRIAKSWWLLLRKASAIGRTTPDVVIVGYLGVLDIHLAKLLFSCPVILDNMAALSSIASDRSLRGAGLLRGIDKLAQRSADVVIWDTVENRDSLAEGGQHEVLRIGAPAAWFSITRPASRPDAAVSVCFFGLYTPLQGACTIARAVALMAERLEVTWTLIGHGQERAAAERLAKKSPRVRWLDWVDPVELPGVVASHDICLGIFGTTPKAARVVPQKLYQGAAAGCALITSDTHPQRSEFHDAATYVAPGDPHALAAAIQVLVENRRLLADMQSASYELARRAFAPGAIALELGPIIQKATSKVPPGTYLNH